jgi:HAE1 family hydrophobic/amphiphilic exporter-1
VTPAGEDLGRVANGVKKVVSDTKLPAEVAVDIRGMVQSMRESFTSFEIGLSLSIALLYLILVAQFSSFKDPFLIMLGFRWGLSAPSLCFH